MINKNALVPVFALAFSVAASGEPPQASTVAIDGKSITVRYSSEAVGGRKIFGGTVPFGKVWRVGAAEGAIFHTDADLVFKGVVVPKGDYALYILPEADKWQLIINRATGAASKRHDPKQDVGRVTMTLGKPPATVEKCKLTLTKTAARAAKLEVAWEGSSATATFHLDRIASDTEW